MKWFLILLALFFTIGCTEAVTVVTDETPTTSVPVKDQMTKADYLAIATGNTCATSKFGNRGTPKQGFMKGIALTYAKTVCNPTGDTYKIASQALGNSNVDALTLYGLTPKTELERLNLTFSLAIGSGGRESSWKWYCGRDASATNTTASTAEAGLYQTSYNSRYNRDGATINAARDKLYKFFKADKSRCFATEYKSGLVGDATNLKNWGTGEGVVFQELSKQCTGFATEYHLMMIRERLTHYGPIKSKDAEIKPVCTDMFVKLNKAIKDNPSLCSQI